MCSVTSGDEDESFWHRLRRGVERLARSQRFNGVVGLIGALLLASLAAYQADRDAHLGASAKVADATVIAVVRTPGKEFRDVEVEFTTADGRVVRAKTDEVEGAYPRAGAHMQVRYDPSDPEEYVRDARLSSSLWLVIFTAAATAVFLWLGILGLLGRLPAWIINFRR